MAQPASCADGVSATIDGRLKGPSPPAAPAAAPTAPWPELLDYEILEELGRGGMGVVYKARQLSLDRTVAIKMIRTGPPSDTTELMRFHAEADVVARLHHPNIVQIYEVGQQDGRPYFSLEFIAGGNLAQRIAGRPQPPLPAAHLIEVLARAIHYAHQCGIIHRDLKPGNILLHGSRESTAAQGQTPGSASLPTTVNTLFPTPKITDFGLARRVDSSHHPTLAGAVMGTPSYMAPEQAEGQTDVLGPGVDVYALGAILYELLTGRPPFRGVTPGETFLQVISRDPEPPRRLQPQVPLDLETICLKCLQKDRRQRYDSPEALADDLRRFQAGEPIRARPSNWRERLVKWGKRHPALVALGSAGASAVLLLLAVSLAFNVQLQRKTDLLAQAADRERQMADEARQQRDKAREHFQLARAAVDRLHAQARSGPDEVAKTKEQLRTELLETALAFYEQFIRGPGATDPELQAEQGRAYQQLAVLYFETGQLKLAEQNCRSALAIRQRLSAAAPDDPARQSELADSYFHLGVLNRALGRNDRSEPAHQQALALRRQLAAEHPQVASYQSDLATSYNNLALLYADSGALERAEDAHQAARSLRQQLAAAHPEVPAYRTDLAGSYLNLGNLYRTTGRRELAEQAYANAVRLHRQQADADPRNLGFQRNLAESCRSLGLLYRSLKRWPEAEQAFEEALGITQRLLAMHPEVPPYQDEFAHCKHYFGLLYQDRHQLERAEQVYQEAAAIRRQRLADRPEVPLHQLRLASTLHNLGKVYADTGRRDQAEQAYREALTLNQGLTTAYPDNLTYAANLGGAYQRLGDLVQKGGQPEAALAWYDQAVGALQKVVQREPRHNNARQMLHRAYRGKADTLDRLNRHAEAVTDWDRAVELGDGGDLAMWRERRALSLARAGDPVRATAAALTLAQAEAASGRTLYQLARVCALSAAVVSQDSRQPAGERERLSAQYAGQSVELLVRAEKAGYFQEADRLQLLKNDRDLDSLRSRADFLKLLALLDAKPRN